MVGYVYNNPYSVELSGCSIEEKCGGMAIVWGSQVRWRALVLFVRWFVRLLACLLVGCLDCCAYPKYVCKTPASMLYAISLLWTADENGRIAICCATTKKLFATTNFFIVRITRQTIFRTQFNSTWQWLWLSIVSLYVRWIVHLEHDWARVWTWSSVKRFVNYQIVIVLFFLFVPQSFFFHCR